MCKDNGANNERQGGVGKRQGGSACVRERQHGRGGGYVSVRVREL
jgi:hypothetical protein